MKQINTEDRKNTRSHSKKILVHLRLQLCSLRLEFWSDEDSFNNAAPLSYILLSQNTHTHTHTHTHTQKNCVGLRKLPVGTAAIIAAKLKTKLRGLSPRANYTDRAAATGRRS